jgi:Tfp pilus assembly protein FimT
VRASDLQVMLHGGNINRCPVESFATIQPSSVISLNIRTLAKFHPLFIAHLKVFGFPQVEPVAGLKERTQQQLSESWDPLMGFVKRMNTRRTEQGFTLVELMVIVGLLVILGLLSTSFNTGSWLAYYRLKGAVRDLSMNMQKARVNAIKDKKSWAIVFDTANSCYYICSDPGHDNSWSSINDNIIDQTIKLSDYKSGTSYGSGTATKNVSGDGVIPSDYVSFNSNVVVFSPNGVPSNSGYCYISNNNNDVCAVGALTSGAIRIRKWNGTAWR